MGVVNIGGIVGTYAGFQLNKSYQDYSLHKEDT